VRGKLKFLSYAPIIFISAKPANRAQRIYPLIDQVAAARKRHISTPDLNRWLKEEVDLQRGSTPKARPVRIYYITQAKTSPPTFLLFTNQKQPLHFTSSASRESTASKNLISRDADPLCAALAEAGRKRKERERGKGIGKDEE